MSMMTLFAECNCLCGVIDMNNAVWIIICVAMICIVALVYIGCHFGSKCSKKKKKIEANTHTTTLDVNGKTEIKVNDKTEM